MKKLFVTGGTVFVSRSIAEYFGSKGWEVYVLNRNTRHQSNGVNLIQADRNDLGEVLRDYDFDVVIDTAYTANEVQLLLDALGSYGDYILISSSAVYPENTVRPFQETAPLGVNQFWGKYGTDKIAAEEVLQRINPNAYILRPPYLYGPMNNVYREAFVFDCAMANRKFYLPNDGSMKLQFFHVNDLCRFIDTVIEKKPTQHIFNVGNEETISIREWVKLCYEITGKQVEFVNVDPTIEQRKYFSFYKYEYELEVSKQKELLEKTKPLREGLEESLKWYIQNPGQVIKKPYLEYIDEHFV